MDASRRESSSSTLRERKEDTGRRECSSGEGGETHTHIHTHVSSHGDRNVEREREERKKERKKNLTLPHVDENGTQALQVSIQGGNAWVPQVNVASCEETESVSVARACGNEKKKTKEKGGGNRRVMSNRGKPRSSCSKGSMFTISLLLALLHDRSTQGEIRAQRPGMPHDRQGGGSFRFSG